MKASANKRLLPIDTEQASQLADLISDDLNKLVDEWYDDIHLLNEIEDECEGKFIDELNLGELSDFVGWRLLTYETTIVPHVGLMPKYGTSAYYRWLSKHRWKKPIQIEVLILKEQKSLRGRYKPRRGKVLVLLPPSTSFNSLGGKRIRNRIYSTLVHELTHAADPHKPQDKPYFLRSREVRARARQLFEELKPILLRMPDTWPDSAKLEQGLSKSKIWKNELRKGDKSTQKTILQYVYTGLVEEGIFGG